MAETARPAPVKADDPSAEALLRRLEWTVLKRLDGLLQGDFRTLRRGNGVDLADLREYQLHDDVRHIDWNVTARLDLPHVRQFTEDRDLTAWFLLDLSGSVDFGSGDTTKLAPGGVHVMLFDIKQQAKVGDKFPLVLKFEKAGEVKVDVQVEDGAPAAHAH